MPGIVIVTYNSLDVIDGCLDSCLRIPGAEVVVVDNASADGTADRVRTRAGVKLIANPQNRGFAAAVNQGFAALNSEAVLILNPDALPIAGISRLEQSVLTGDFGAATGRLIGEDGRQQHGFNIRALPTAATLAFEALGLNRIWPGNPVNRRYRLPTPQTEADVEQPAAAFLMVRRSAWQTIGGFDESFFPIWFEDVDFCKRLCHAGYRIRYIPEAEAQHQGGHSAAKLSWGERQVFWYGSLLKYASKHFAVGSRRGVGLAVVLASVLRVIAAVPKQGIAKPVSAFSKVVRLAGRCLR